MIDIRPLCLEWQHCKTILESHLNNKIHRTPIIIMTALWNKDKCEGVSSTIIRHPPQGTMIRCQFTNQQDMPFLDFFYWESNKIEGVHDDTPFHISAGMAPFAFITGNTNRIEGRTLIRSYWNTWNLNKKNGPDVRNGSPRFMWGSRDGPRTPGLKSPPPNRHHTKGE